jgi:hypothetical protein
MALIPQGMLRTTVQSGLLGDEAFPKPGPSHFAEVQRRVNNVKALDEQNLFRARFRANEDRVSAALNQERFRDNIANRMPGLRAEPYAQQQVR